MSANESRFWSNICDQYIRIAESRLTMVFPFLLDVIEPLGLESLLDYGCGDGRFVQSAIDAGTVDRGVNYDIAEEMLKRARMSGRGRRISAIANMESVSDESIDAVTAIAVWMCLNSEDACASMVVDAHRVLKPNGHFFAAVTHPCFRNQRYSTFRTSFDLRNYLSSGSRFSVTISDGNEKVVVEDAHWSIDDMTRQLQAAGMLLQRIYEVPDAENRVGAAWMVLHARKIAIVDL